MTSILFVCTGNICRSPSAEGYMRHVASMRGLALSIDSAGTHGYHIGDPPDERSQAAASKRGFDISDLQARAVNVGDFDRFDYILTMDAGHTAHMKAMQPAGSKAIVQPFLLYAKNNDGLDVPDPYYGSIDGFEHVLDLIERATDGFLDTLTNPNSPGETV